jgi:hypothetical protein
MNSCKKEQKEIDACFREVQACIGFAGAIKLIHERPPNACSGTQAKMDLVVDRLATELDGRLRNLGSALHEQYVRNHPLTVIGPGA